MNLVGCQELAAGTGGFARLRPFHLPSPGGLERPVSFSPLLFGGPRLSLHLLPLLPLPQPLLHHDRPGQLLQRTHHTPGGPRTGADAAPPAPGEGSAAELVACAVASLQLPRHLQVRSVSCLPVANISVIIHCVLSRLIILQAHHMQFPAAEHCTMVV